MESRIAPVLDRRLAIDLVNVTERAAVAAARWRGRGDEPAAEEAAIQGAHRELMRCVFTGRIAIGEGPEAATQRLFHGEAVGMGGPEVDIAIDALEGTTLCAKNMSGSISVVVVAEPGSLLTPPPVYMEKVAIGPGYPAGIVSLAAPPGEMVRVLAEARGVATSQITALVLDRPRHSKLIEAVRQAGASVKLITDGDVAGIIHTTTPKESGVDLYLGSGGAAEGVLAAAALRCMGGQMEGRLVLDTEAKRKQAKAMGFRDFDRVYKIEDMVKGDCLVSVTGVTDGALLDGVRFGRDTIKTDTLLMRAATGILRRVTSTHRDLGRFAADE
ncbi:fructose-bisphosphatase class II family protein [Aquabacter spiritensis]|uniref:Fructose-1,6-bisphosphatase n=1 Tax=Aquabacter spiritensis TaxID=933073 RepID=A0A4R3LNH3_9HYPH|nr:fructose-bisphosphatase class II family protein [Aquabacter spiritensis]TCT00989.1 fructose-1,6-bisphosphatase II / sedoheptulose-1,7-bisphosphatase [Aquabacter spiritensis]